MKKIVAMCLVVMLLFAVAGCGEKSSEHSEESDWMFSEEDLAQVNEDNTTAYINGEKINDESAADLIDDINDSAIPVAGVPDGFPESMPLYSGAQIISADEYGNNDYMMVYMVSAPYVSVVSF